MEMKVQNKKNKYKLSEPVLFPPLSKSIAPLETDEDKYQEIGEITVNLLKQGELSIYKLLFERGHEEGLFIDVKGNSIRNEYLKKIVAGNEEYFPHELGLDKFKRRADLSFEEKLQAKIALVNNEKQPKPKKKNDKDLEASRKVSNAEVKESGDIPDKLKANLNDEALKVIEDESSDEEQEDRSFEEDDYLMGSEDGRDAGDDESREDNFSDGGVF